MCAGGTVYVCRLYFVRIHVYSIHVYVSVFACLCYVCMCDVFVRVCVCLHVFMVVCWLCCVLQALSGVPITMGCVLVLQALSGVPITAVRDLGVGLDTSCAGGRATLPWQEGDMMITFTLAAGATLTLRASGEGPHSHCGPQPGAG